MDKIIGVCGFISTGSSAVSDLLKEFKENIVFDDFEFDFTYIPDSIEDLAYHLNEGSSKIESSIVALARFKKLSNIRYLNKINKETNNKFRLLTKEYINKITQVEWYGKHHIDFILYPNEKIFKSQRVLLTYILKLLINLEKIIKRQINIFPLHKYSTSIYPENFYEITKKYIDDILVSMGKESGKNFVLDQPFAGNNPEKSFRYFNNPKAIIVDRDPRDHYLFGKKFLRPRLKPYYPTEKIEDYVKFYRYLRSDSVYMKNSQNILSLKFEDMIYEYDKTVNKIMEFLNLKIHAYPKTIFEPSLSINNTQLSKIYPDCKEDIAYIEKELPEYLYPFENYRNIKTNQGKMFLGKSLLNKK
jgi:hypothetical protein